MWRGRRQWAEPFNNAHSFQTYGWWPNLVDSWVCGVHGFFTRFLILYGCFGGRDVSHWIGSTVGIQNAWFSAREVKYGSSFDFELFMIFELFKKVATILWPGIYCVFGLELSENNFRVFWSEPKKVRRKVMQILGGITSRSALFDLFMPI